MPIAAALLTPELDRVGSYIRTLTRSGGGGEQGTFTDNTRPTATVAQVYAERAARYLALQLGTPDSDWEDDAHAEELESAKDAAAAYAALQIATSFYDDGSETISSLVDQLGRLAREQIKAVVEAARTNNTGGSRIHSIPTLDAGRSGAGDIADLQPPGTDPDLLLLNGQVGNGPDEDWL